MRPGPFLFALLSDPCIADSHALYFYLSFRAPCSTSLFNEWCNIKLIVTDSHHQDGTSDVTCNSSV